jgi:glycosyltransferase involved in cell wall biosynthesis
VGDRPAARRPACAPGGREEVPVVTGSNGSPWRGGARPRLCFVGPLVGAAGTRVLAQGLVLRDLFRRAGFDAVGVSEAQNRYVRLADIAQFLVRRRREVDVVVLEVYGGRSFVVEDLASALARRFGLPLVMHLHGGALPEFYARFPRWSERVMRRADAIVAPSPFLARSVDRFGLDATVIPNVLDLSRYPYRLREGVSPRLFWMRSMHPTWNPQMAVRTLSLLRESDAGAALTLAGQDKGLLPEVKRLAAELGVGDSVRYPGFLDMEGKAREGGAADVYINTNRVDNAPVAVLEACAMGLPVVSTNVGGIPDLLEHGRTALLVGDDDAAAMAAAVRRLVEEPGLARRLSREGRALAERSSWESVLPQWQAVFATASHHGAPAAAALSFGRP